MQVTGSRLGRANEEGAQPALVFSRRQIQRSGQSSIAEFLRQSPVNVRDMVEQIVAWLRAITQRRVPTKRRTTPPFFTSAARIRSPLTSSGRHSPMSNVLDTTRVPGRMLSMVGRSFRLTVGPRQREHGGVAEVGLEYVALFELHLVGQLLDTDMTLRELN